MASVFPTEAIFLLFTFFYILNGAIIAAAVAHKLFYYRIYYWGINMYPITEKMKEKLTQLNGSIAKTANAGRGFVTLVSEESKKQFSDLIKTGEAQQNQGLDILSHVKITLPESLDVTASAKTLGFAALGLINKTKTNSTKLFNELIALGNTEVSAKVSARKNARKAA